MKKTVSLILVISVFISLIFTNGALAAFKGDVNDDDEVNNKDVVTMFRYVSGSDKLDDESAYDYNDDGEVDNKDVVSLFRFVSSGAVPEEIEPEIPEPTPDEYFKFTLLDNGTYEIKAKDKNNLPNDMVIPDEHDGKPVTSIGGSAFYDCSGLASVTIPDSVTSIGWSAFTYCISLTSVTIGDGVMEIGSGAFSYCNSLESITVSDNNKKYHSSGNCLIETEIKMLIAGSKNSTIPNDGSVTSIGDGAFIGCSGLISVTISDGVTLIDEDAFRYCSNLTYVTIQEGVTSIGDGAFYSCGSLTSVTIPDSVTSIGSGVFAGCISLTDIIYKGTYNQWKSILRGWEWNEEAGNYTLHCSDGDYSKDGNKL